MRCSHENARVALRSYGSSAKAGRIFYTDSNKSCRSQCGSAFASTSQILSDSGGLRRDIAGSTPGRFATRLFAPAIDFSSKHCVSIVSEVFLKGRPFKKTFEQTMMIPMAGSISGV